MHTEKPTQAPPASRFSVFGFVTAFLAVLAFVCAGAVGLAWIASLVPEIPRGGEAAAYLIRAAVVSLPLAAFFGIVAIALRGDRFRLWRGAALSLALAGLHGGLIGLVQVVNHLTPLEMTLPAWAPAVASLAFSGGVIAALRQRFLLRPAPASLILSAALGVIVALGWVWVGSMGRLTEVGLSLPDALAPAAAAAVLTRCLFAFDDDFPVRRPGWAGLLVALAYPAFMAGLLAARGFFLQDGLLALTLIPAGLIVGGLFTLDDPPQPGRQWWAVMAFTAAALLVAFNWASGVEGDYMLEDLAPAWLPALTTGLVAGAILGLGLQAARRWLRPAAIHPGVAGGAAAAALIGLVALAGLTGRSDPQPETFFVVMADQADTSSARSIHDLTARRAQVYQTLTAQANRSQADLRAWLDARHVRYKAYYVVSGMEVYGDPLLRAQVAARPDVARVLNSPHARPLPPGSQGITLSASMDQIAGMAWGVRFIKADQAWALGVNGQGVLVGSADTGVEWTHPALKAQYAGQAGDHNYTWFDSWGGSPQPIDEMGHGTHTTGIVLGQGGIGVAPGARWIACRNLARNLGNPGVYLGCMQFLFAPFPLTGDPFTDGDPGRGADVVNNSWGCPPTEGCDAVTLSIALRHLADAGQFYVVSAGNDGPTCATVSPPATAPDALAVGAVGPGGDLAYFSSRGPVSADGSGRIKPDVVAPGESILSSVPGGGYAAFDGTSMSGPHVAGVVALMWSANPALKGNIALTRQIIEQTARPLSGPPDECGLAAGGQDDAAGFGAVDALAAVQKALSLK